MAASSEPHAGDRKNDRRRRQHGRRGKLTPMLAQYLEIKGRHPEALLLFRMGDFYETFFDDAEVLARTAGVALTSRDAKSDNPVPLAGVPHHAIDTYLARLLGAGLTVAICEQVEDPAQAKGLVKREVVEIISPGTATAPELVQEARGLYCLAYLPAAETAGWALVDASTGDFACGQEPVALADLCERHPVREVIVREDASEADLQRWRAVLADQVLNRVNAAWFHPVMAARTLTDHFGVANLSAFGLEGSGRELAVAASGALLRYLGSLALRRPEQITSLRFSRPTDRLQLDEETLRNLEVFRTFRGERGAGTLIHHIDGTTTALGRRLLARRLAEPLTDLAELALWHEGIAQAVTARSWREDLRTVLRRIGDLERLAARAANARIGPAQLAQLGGSLAAVAELVATATAEPRQHPITTWASEIPPLENLARRIARTLPDEPPARLRQGGVIREGVDKELDRCRAIASDTKGFLAGLQQDERSKTGIPTLKIGYNKVFGYYFEVTNKHLAKVPAHYQQKQTLVNAARFHTAELQEAEAKILAAEEQAKTLEREIFAALVSEVAAQIGTITRAARRVAAIDLLLGHATIAEKHAYCRPVCDESDELVIEGGRHPVVEQLLDHDFIPNDTLLNGADRQLLLLTGPNMGGKSTYLRQIALIALMAQAGGFVSAQTARVGAIDRIFTRVGASDNLARGESTFFTEMNETAHILHQMTSRSLVILDEVGRGTATYDGLSLAWAITEFLGRANGPRPRSVFATHYHELENRLPGLVNLMLAVKEWEGRIIFMHAVKPGRSDKSYGIHVARLAGIPDPVLERAEEILARLSSEDRRALPHPRTETAEPGGASLVAEDREGRPEAVGGRRRQLSLFAEGERDALRALRELDLDGITPVDAFMWLVRIQRQLLEER